MKKIYLSAILAFFFSIIHAQINMSAARPFLDEGKTFLQNGNRKEATKAFDKAIRASKEKKYKEGYPEVYTLIGDIYLNATSQNKCNLCDAFAYYTRSRDIEPLQKDIWKKMNDERFKQLIKDDFFCADCLNN